MPEEKTLKKIVTQDFGICPACGSKMVYLLSNYQMAVPAPGGRHLKFILGEDSDITAVCSNPDCNRKYAMTSSIYGITTRDYALLAEDRRNANDRKTNLIGYIDEDKK